ncbi:MAG: DUF2304 domain-containing protein [Desulfobacteraceae bacterium]|jgi:hypothetical protein|nr:MAG: DUF2304 domain-containing protein [Desulfobacteraceae bacterium]
MISYRVTSILIGLVIFLLIVRLVRQGRLQERHSILWFIMAIVIVVLAVFPPILNKMARFFGISYAPNLLLLMGLGILLVQNLYLFLHTSRHEANIRELTQQVALINRLVEELSEREGKVNPSEKRSPP